MWDSLKRWDQTSWWIFSFPDACARFDLPRKTFEGHWGNWVNSNQKMGKPNTCVAWIFKTYSVCILCVKTLTVWPCFFLNSVSVPPACVLFHSLSTDWNKKDQSSGWIQTHSHTHTEQTFLEADVRCQCVKQLEPNTFSLIWKMGKFTLNLLTTSRLLDNYDNLNIYQPEWGGSEVALLN